VRRARSRPGADRLGAASVTNRACQRNAARSNFSRLMLRAKANRLWRLFERQVPGLSGGELGVEKPATLDRPPEPGPRIALRCQQPSRGRTAHARLRNRLGCSRVEQVRSASDSSDEGVRRFGGCFAFRFSKMTTKEAPVSLWLLILIIVIVVLLLGGFGYSRRA
jgi:hypothetical protein